MTSSQRLDAAAGPHTGDPALPSAHDLRARQRSLLSHAIAEDIIPRLVQAHASSDEPWDPVAPAGSSVTPEDVHTLAIRLLMAADEPARETAVAVRQRGVTVESLFMDLLAGAARLIGTWWVEDRCSFADVTVGVGRLQQILREHASGLVSRPHPSNPPLRVLLLPTPGEQHSFGMVMVSEFFRAAGWDVAGGPAAALDPVAIVRRDWYDVVGFSLGAEVYLPKLSATISAVRKASQNPRLGVLVGGALFMADPARGVEVGADAVAVNGSLAPEIAAKLVGDRVKSV